MTGLQVLEEGLCQLGDPNGQMGVEQLREFLEGIEELFGTEGGSESANREGGITTNSRNIMG